MGDRMKEFIGKSARIYCDYTVFLNESFKLFCENNRAIFKETGIKLNIPQPVVDELKAVPMSRMDDYVLCCQGLERIAYVQDEWIAVITDGEGYSEEYFYRLCEQSEEDIIVMTNDIQLVSELADICASSGKAEGFLTVLEIEENGMVHRLR